MNATTTYTQTHTHILMGKYNRHIKIIFSSQQFSSYVIQHFMYISFAVLFSDIGKLYKVFFFFRFLSVDSKPFAIVLGPAKKCLHTNWKCKCMCICAIGMRDKSHAREREIEREKHIERTYTILLQNVCITKKNFVEVHRDDWSRPLSCN